MIFNSFIARNSLYLDFEGEGKSKNKGTPLPHMAGVFRPDPVSGGGGSYHAIFFKELWAPAKNGASGKAQINGFDESIKNIIKEAEDKRTCIVYWSDYERSVIELNTPELLHSFENVSFNLLPPYRTIKNRRKLSLDQNVDKVLNQYLKAFLPNRPPVSPYKLGPAEACKRIDNFSSRYPRWKSWPADKQQYLYDLLKYNEEDCRATWWLGRKLGNTNEKKR